MMPLINSVEGLSPGGIMLAITTVLIITLILFGLRAPPQEQVQDIGMPQGFDSATQAEQALFFRRQQHQWLMGLGRTATHNSSLSTAREWTSHESDGAIIAAGNDHAG